MKPGVTGEGGDAKRAGGGRLRHLSLPAGRVGLYPSDSDAGLLTTAGAEAEPARARGLLGAGRRPGAPAPSRKPLVSPQTPLKLTLIAYSFFTQSIFHFLRFSFARASAHIAIFN
ncbi:unnamed protein product [Parnassius apollo]|uniref:(apollo) hypothetical protein n=1 Tax=Parnassius apollo TaxID=110799 RepID=A0A8S3YB88_PARAO|nr:unnamed protein product [Parnassius apollo]